MKNKRQSPTPRAGFRRPAVIVPLLPVLLAVIAAACAPPADTTAPSRPGGTAALSAIADIPTAPADSMTAIALEWAEAVKNRDGKAQYALMTKALQAEVIDEFSALNWVTGTSSPWVEGYTVEETATGVRVTFDYAASTGPAGSYYQDLTFETEDGELRIAEISDLQEVPAAEAES